MVLEQNNKEVGEKTISRQRRWQLKRVAEGLCATCSDPARPGKKMCQKCADKANERSKRWQANHPNYMQRYLTNYRKKKEMEKESGKESPRGKNLDAAPEKV